MKQAPVVKKSIREQFLDYAYESNPHKDVLFSTETTCRNCNCEFVQVLAETLFRRTYACMYCGIVFHREAMQVA